DPDHPLTFFNLPALYAVANGVRVIALARFPWSFIMSHDDPFTSDLFGNTVLSSGLGLGVTAFGSSLAPDDDDDPDPVPPTPVALAKPEDRKAGSPSHTPRGENYHLA